MKNAIFLVLLFFSFWTYGQELSFGDSTVMDVIKKKTSNIYEDKDDTKFLLTKKQLRRMKTYGTNIVAYSKKDTINRIVAMSMTKKGHLATEWYFANEQLIYVYESFEFFKEKEKVNAWENFKGIGAWESRYYFVNEKIKYHKHKGRTKNELSEKTINKAARDLLIDARTILNYITKK